MNATQTGPFRYLSPLRALDLGWAEKTARQDGVPYAVDWDATTIGPWEPATTVYAFVHPLPERFVRQWSLQEVKS
jgi:hypothetical protein